MKCIKDEQLIIEAMIVLFCTVSVLTFVPPSRFPFVVAKMMRINKIKAETTMSMIRVFFDLKFILFLAFPEQVKVSNFSKVIYR